MEKGLAIITGADGGMGQVITAALAKEGYPVTVSYTHLTLPTILRV